MLASIINVIIVLFMGVVSRINVTGKAANIPESMGHTYKKKDIS